ncbi:hypothetical protein PHJA_002813700 [Phtheirospermum japonicum]|uniref:HMA domain-containing protein n=1 Tax=Phtheirospermum japonicum TaxID=374723 RepID=A0A830D4T3_9LAMI|nr:hypothetical protein PHJA_002813700 [Phtheirospermum japonicum]
MIKQQQDQSEESKVCEHPKNSNKENPNEKNKNNPNNGIIILGVYIHCEGCENEVLKCLRGFEGVDGIEIDANNQKVIVKGKKADPIKVAERLRKKTGKHVKLISPQPKKQVKEEKKPEPEPKVIEVVLKIHMHCKGCAKDVKHCIHDLEGVQTVEPEMTKNLVMVKGTMDPQKLVEFISKRGGWRATIQDNKEKKKEEVHNHKDDTICYIYPPEPLYAPQLFSDENPNSCSMM